MKGHVARKRDRYYAVIYEGLDPVTGKERRSWHPAGTDRTEAEALVARLATERDGRNDEVRSPIPRVEQKAWTADELRVFLRAAAGHRLFPALWLSANTGVRRSELLGRRWSDLDVDPARLSINRGLVAVSYELHESRGKTDNSRRCIDLDQTTLAVLAGWRALQSAEFAAVGVEDPGWMFTSASGGPVHPHSISQTFDRIVRRSPVPVIPFHGLRHTHASLLIANGVNAKVASERLGHGEFVFTVQTYQHTFPAMHTDAARIIETLLTPGGTENPALPEAG